MNAILEDRFESFAKAADRDEALLLLARAVRLTTKGFGGRWVPEEQVVDAFPFESLKEQFVPGGPLIRQMLVAAELAQSEGRPTVAALLTELSGARRASEVSAPAGSVLRAAAEGRLDNLEVEVGSVQATLLAFHSYVLRHPETEGIGSGAVQRLAVWLARRAVNGRMELACSDDLETWVDWPYDEAIVRKAFERAATADHFIPTEELFPALFEHASSRGNSLASWLAEGLRTKLGLEEQLFEAQVEDRRVRWLWAEGQAVGPSRRQAGALTWPMRILVDQGGELVDAWELELGIGQIEPGDFTQPQPRTPEEQKTVQAAFDAWRSTLAQQVAATPAEDLEHFHLEHRESFELLLPMLRVWLKEGPTPERPQRVAWDEQRLAELARSFRCEHRLEPASHWKGTEHVFDLHVGGYTVRLRCFAPDGLYWVSFGLGPEGGPVVTLSEGDPVPNAPLGDPVAFRDVASALRALVERTDNDVMLTGTEDENVDEEDDEAEEPLRLTDVLAFGDYLVGPPSFDWRVELDFARVAPPEDVATRLREWPSDRRDWESQRALYARFIRDVFDPTHEPSGPR